MLNMNYIQYDILHYYFRSASERDAVCGERTPDH